MSVTGPVTLELNHLTCQERGGASKEVYQPTVESCLSRGYIGRTITSCCHSCETHTKSSKTVCFISHFSMKNSDKLT